MNEAIISQKCLDKYNLKLVTSPQIVLASCLGLPTPRWSYALAEALYELIRDIVHESHGVAEFSAKMEDLSLCIF
jgi:hypothetical protein